MGIYTGRPCGPDCHRFRMVVARDWRESAALIVDAILGGKRPQSLPPHSFKPADESGPRVDFDHVTHLRFATLELSDKVRSCGVGLPTDALQDFSAIASAWREGELVPSLATRMAYSKAESQALQIEMDAMMRLSKSPGDDDPGRSTSPSEEALSKRQAPVGKRGRKPSDVTPMEQDVLNLYQKRHGQPGVIKSICEDLRPTHPSLTLKGVNAIIRKLKARKDGPIKHSPRASD